MDTLKLSLDNIPGVELLSDIRDYDLEFTEYMKKFDAENQNNMDLSEPKEVENE
jgi:hypothetical protein